MTLIYSSPARPDVSGAETGAAAESEDDTLKIISRQGEDDDADANANAGTTTPL